MSKLSFKEVTKSFGAKEVIFPLTLELADGAFTALLGPSGCGKTTLLRMAAGLEDPSGGEIRIGERRVFGAGSPGVPPEERGLGMVFQSYAVWPHMTVARTWATRSSSAGGASRPASANGSCVRPSTWSRWRRWPRATRTSSRAASSSGSRSRAESP